MTTTTTLFLVLSLILFFLILTAAAKIVDSSFLNIAKRFRGGEFIMANFIIALGTSFPELIIAINSALDNNTSLSLGNIFGSNIANLSLVIGLSTLISGKLFVSTKCLKNHFIYVFIIAIAPTLLLADGQLSRLDGLLLVAFYLVWQFYIITNPIGLPSRKFIANRRAEKLLSHVSNRYRHLNLLKSNHYPLTQTVTLIIGMITLVIAASAIVKISLEIANAANIPAFVIGVFILGIGSTLPELIFSIEALKEKENEAVLGNLFGSIVVNSSLILGIATLISPPAPSGNSEYLFVSGYLALIFLIFYIFIRSKHKLEKWEGAFLVASYIVLLSIQFI